MAIGDLVGVLSDPSVPGAVFSIVENPGGAFAIQGGNNLVQAVDLSAGTFDVTFGVTAPSVSFDQAWVLTFGPSVDVRVTDTGDTRVTDTGDTRIATP